MSTLPGFVFGRSSRQNTFPGASSGGSASKAPLGAQKDGTARHEKGVSASVPKVKSFLSRAKSLRLGRGLGLGTGGEEARKETRMRTTGRRGEKKRESKAMPMTW